MLLKLCLSLSNGKHCTASSFSGSAVTPFGDIIFHRYLLVDQVAIFWVRLEVLSSELLEYLFFPQCYYAVILTGKSSEVW
jgi:hypothetical protein